LEQHLILTRFSVRFEGDRGPHAPEWLDRRLELLEAYCLPGLAQQTRGDFTWALLCDRSTDPAFLARLRRVAGEVRGASILLTDRAHSLLPPILELVDRDADVLVSSRVDSDDALALDFVERVRDYVPAFRASGEDSLLVNFSQGLKLVTDGGELYDSYQPYSPYVSLLESLRGAREPLTVIRGNHGHLYLEHPLHEDASAPAWLQVVHGGNVSNHVHAADKRIADQLPLAGFALRPEAARRASPPAAPLSPAGRREVQRGLEPSDAPVDVPQR
jgi:hypothetical protein